MQNDKLRFLELGDTGPTCTLPPPPLLTFSTHSSRKRSPVSRYTRVLPSEFWTLNFDSSEKRTAPHCLLVHLKWALAHPSRPALCLLVRIDPFFGRRHLIPTARSRRLIVSGCTGRLKMRGLCSMPRTNLNILERLSCYPVKKYVELTPVFQLFA